MTPDTMTPPPDYTIPSTWNLDAETRSFMKGHTWNLVLQGISDSEEYVAMFEDVLTEAGVAEDEARIFFDSVVESRRVQQRSWNDAPITRLSTAFDELESLGVVARQHFSYCGTCATTEIWDERDDSRTWRGYIYFHQQDTESIFRDRTTYIGYGAFLDAYIPEDEWNALSDDQKNDRYAATVTSLMEDEVFPVLANHGIEVEWNRDLGRRILLQNVDFFAPIPDSDGNDQGVRNAGSL